MDRLSPGVSGGDQVPDVVFPTGMDVVRLVKTFGTVIGPGQRPEHATHLAVSLHDYMWENSLVD